MMKNAWKVFVAALLALATSITACGPAFAQIGGPVMGGGAVGTANITGGTISNATISNPTFTGLKKIPQVWASYHIPIVFLPTTTYNNNGAATLGTALNTTYGGFWAVVPANSIAAGTPAATDIYWATASSTTAITLFNNRLADNLDSVGGPTIPASPTPFVTTGAGSVAGVTAQVTILTLALPAATMSTTGILDFDNQWAFNNSANNHTVVMTFGAATALGANVASAAFSRQVTRIRNRNSASVQEINSTLFSSNLYSPQAITYSAVNTANAVNIAFSPTRGTATDTLALESIQIVVTN